MARTQPPWCLEVCDCYWFPADRQNEFVFSSDICLVMTSTARTMAALLLRGKAQHPAPSKQWERRSGCSAANAQWRVFFFFYTHNGRRCKTNRKNGHRCCPPPRMPFLLLMDWETLHAAKLCIYSCGHTKKQKTKQEPVQYFSQHAGGRTWTRTEPGGGGGGRLPTTTSYPSIHRGPPASHDSKQYSGPLCCSLITAGTCRLIVVQLAQQLIEGMHADELEDSLTASLDL